MTKYFCFIEHAFFIGRYSGKKLYSHQPSCGEQFGLLKDVIHNFENGKHEIALQSLLRFTNSTSELKRKISSKKHFRANLLHHAAFWGWVNIIKKLIDDHGFDPMSTDARGRTAVHYAAEGVKFEGFEVLVTQYHCDPTCQDLKREIPLFLAIKAGCFDIIKYYMTSLGLGYDGNTICNGKPLGIIAAEHGHLEILKYLREECKFDVSKTCSENKTALDVAAIFGHFDIVKYLIVECKCDPNKKEWYSMKPLHHASEKGHIDIVKYLISECKSNVHDAHKGLSPLQYAAENGHFELVKYFVLACNCNPDSAIENAIKGKHDDIVKYLASPWRKNETLTERLYDAVFIPDPETADFLINKCGVKANESTDIKGKTLLHCAASGGSSEHRPRSINDQTTEELLVVQCLLAAGLDPLKRDKNGDTPFAIARRSTNRKVIMPYFEAFGKSKTMYPVDSYVNVLIVGNSGAGKSTLCKVIQKTKYYYLFQKFTYVSPSEVEPLTAGIVPIKLHHRQLRNVVLHDFAGNSQYYLSHTAVIENILQGSAAVFIIVVDVSNSDYLIHLKQWLSVVRNEIQKAKYDCHVIVVASHADCLNSRAEKGKIIENLDSELKDKDNIQCLNCRKLGGKKFNSFFIKLQNACIAIRKNDERSLTLYCHMMYNLLQNNKKKVLTLRDIVDDLIKELDNCFLPFDSKQILYILLSLHSTGLIYYLNCEDNTFAFNLKFNPETFEVTHNISKDCKIWVVKDKMKFLKYVNGLIFSRKTYKEHPNIVENGIITAPFLKQLFPDDDLIMIISFLESMGLCHEVSPFFLQQTNLIKKDQIGREDVICLFFPSLVDLSRPSNDNTFCFGWFLECIEDDQWFSPRFFNYLMLHLSLKHASEEKAATVHQIRKCNNWKNGVKWGDENGVVTSVELVNDNRCVLILMSCDEGDEESMISLRRTIIKDVLNNCREYCPTLKVEEFVIDPDCLKSYPIEKPRETTAYCVKNIRNRKKNSTVVYPTYPSNPISNLKGKRVCEILPNEPDSDNLSIYGEVKCTLISFILYLCYR